MTIKQITMLNIATVLLHARHRAAIPATTATETARPMVPGRLDGERQLLRTGLRQGAGRYSQERLVSSRLARERQLLHPLRDIANALLVCTAPEYFDLK